MIRKVVWGALALAVLVWGASLLNDTSTGPARDRDVERLSDLRDLSGFLLCSAALNDHTLPETLTPLSGCGSKTRFSDPYTDAPYSYDVLPSGEFRICAAFERGKSLPDYWFGLGNFDKVTGCATVPYAPNS